MRTELLQLKSLQPGEAAAVILRLYQNGQVAWDEVTPYLDRRVADTLASYPETPAGILLGLLACAESAALTREKAVRRLLKWPEPPAELWPLLLKHGSRSSLRSAVRKASAPVEFLYELAERDDDDLLCAVAAHRRVPANLKRHLVRSNSAVRLACIRDGSVLRSVDDWVARLCDQDVACRRAVARRADFPWGAMVQLACAYEEAAATSHQEPAAGAVAAEHSPPGSSLEEVSDPQITSEQGADGAPNARRRARLGLVAAIEWDPEFPARLERLLKEKRAHAIIESISRRLVGRRDVNVACLKGVLGICDEGTRTALYLQESSSPLIVDLLKGEELTRVRTTVARAISTPDRIAMLCRMEDPAIAVAIRARRDLPASLAGSDLSDYLKVLFAEYERIELDRKITIAGMNAVPEKYLLRLASDPSADVRRTVASRKRLPLTVAQVLANDSDRAVIRVLLEAGWRTQPAVWTRALRNASLDEKVSIVPLLEPQNAVFSWAGREGEAVKDAVASCLQSRLSAVLPPPIAAVELWPAWLQRRVRVIRTRAATGFHTPLPNERNDDD